MRFTRHRKQVRADPDATEVALLTQLATELLGLIEAPAISDDPLAEMVGMPPGDVDPPDNEVLERLFPDAYKGDPEAAREFRRYTDSELRQTKRANAKALIASLPEGGGVFELDRDLVDVWLASLNDMRLALGTSLDVTEETDYETDDEPALQVYAWLGWLQESLLSCVDPRPPRP